MSARYNINKFILKVVTATICFWLGNVGCQYFAVTFGSWGSLETMSSPALGEFLLGLIKTEPLCLSFERTPLVVGALFAFFSIMFTSMSRVRYNNEVAFDHQYDTAKLATKEQAMELAHLKPYWEAAPKKFFERASKHKTAIWAKPWYLESLVDDNLLLAADSWCSASRIPRIKNYYGPDEDYDAEGRIKNRHIWVLATSGSGKTYSWLTSNVLNLLGSMLFLDPKGELFARFAAFLEAHGYTVLVLDLRDEAHMLNSCHFNPLSYIDCTPITKGMDWHDFHINQTMADTVIDMFIDTTRSKHSKGEQDFFVNHERNIYKAFVYTMVIRFKACGFEKDCNIPAMLSYLNLCGANRDADKFNMDDLDRFFYGTWEEDHVYGLKDVIIYNFGQEAWDAPGIKPWTPVFEAYEGFKTAKEAPETKAGILSSCFARLQRFLNPALRSIVCDDEFEFDEFGKKKTAIFCCIPTGDEESSPYSFLVSMFLNELFEKQIEVANASSKGCVDIPEWYFLDEVSNLPKIPKLAEVFGFGRSYGINVAAIMQTESMMVERYGKEKVTQMRGNTALQVYLGFRDADDAKKLSDAMGSRTEVVRSWSYNTSYNSASSTESYHANKKPIMSVEELLTFNDEMPNGRKGLRSDECITKIGTQPYYVGRKLDPTKHRRWQELEGYGSSDIVNWQKKRRAAQANMDRTQKQLPPNVEIVDPNDPNTILVMAG